MKLHSVLLIFFFCAFCQTSPNSKDRSSDFSIDENRADLLWEQKCAACHGVDGTPKDSVLPKPKKLRGFGIKMGFFFGGDKMREGIFKTIRDGKNQTMPSFKDELSEEEIRALVKRIERF
ncbi:c-type cytochrome [Leptospira ainazelensis]|uniref:c-type cytochrome n=1 Tax=Leptospira ainazelensis TaxID=2810034 RepID=UPI001E422840|nr:cytochrome c [Leptospira ainazelensis]